MNKNEFENIISELTQATAGQYPRPWTADFRNPLEAEGMILGFNQARTYSDSDMSHKEFMDWHMGRKGTSYELYNQKNQKPSPTRENIAELSRLLGGKILESDVYCFSSPKARDLSSLGKTQGRRISHAVLAGVAPKFLIIYGTGPKKAFWKELKSSEALLEKADLASEPNLSAFKITLDRSKLCKQIEGSFQTLAIFIPSLSLPQWNKWKFEAPETFSRLKKLLHSHGVL